MSKIQSKHLRHRKQIQLACVSRTRGRNPLIDYKYNWSDSNCNKSLNTARLFIIRMGFFLLFLMETCVVETNIGVWAQAEFLAKAPTMNCVCSDKKDSLSSSDFGRCYEETYIVCYIGHCISQGIVPDPALSVLTAKQSMACDEHISLLDMSIFEETI